MPSITLSQPAFFRNGAGGASKVVGVESGCNRVARYSFTSPPSGASSAAVSVSGMWFGSGTRPDSFRFYIGTDPLSHINAGADSPRTGLLQGQSATAFSGTAQVLLLPNTDYYLFVFPNSAAFGWYNWEGSAALTLSGGSCSIPTVSADPVDLGTELTIFTNRHGDFTHTLSYQFGQDSGIIAQGVTDSALWTPPLELASQIPNGQKGVCTISCATFDGDTQLGPAQSVSLMLTVPESVCPTVSALWTDLSGAYDKLGRLVKLVSALSVEVEGQGAYGSTVTGASLTLNGKPYAGGTILEFGDLPLVVTVTDSRGRTGSREYTLTVADYAVPSLTLTAHRCTADGTADDTGEYALVTLTGSTADLPGNTAALDLSYGQAQVAVGEFTHSVLIPAPSTASLPLSATLTDSLCSTTRTMVLSVGYATMDFLRGGRGIALGTTATREGLTCAMDVEFLGKVSGTIFQAVYPVDSVCFTCADANPAQLFGGSWELLQSSDAMTAWRRTA